MLSAATDPAGIPSLAVYGVAAVPMAFLIAALRWALLQMKTKDTVIERLNDRLIVQGDLAIKQAEKLAPLISDASRVLNQAIDELAPRFEGRAKR
jgi:hypothetical protein